MNNPPFNFDTVSQRRFMLPSAAFTVGIVVVGGVAICSGMGSRQNILNKMKKLTPETVDPN